MGQHGYIHGDFGWTELQTTDPDAALAFYSAIAGWERKEVPMPDYHAVGRGDEMLGGISRVPEGGGPPRWMPYITVEDIEGALARVGELGGSIIQPATALPGDAGFIAVIRDPQGTLTGLAQYPASS